MTLGPTSGRIVGEVVLGLLQTDPGSYVNQQNWRPLVPAASGQFRMTDFLNFAGVAGRR